MKALLARRGVVGGRGGAAAKAAGGGPAGGARAAHSDGIAMTTRIAVLVAVLGLIGSVAFGVLWWRTEHGPGVQVAAARDSALASARQIAVNLQTLDYRTVGKGLDNWEASATGPLLAEFQQNYHWYAAQITSVQTTTTARLVDAALCNLDATGGKAIAIAAVDVSTTKMVNGAPSLPIARQVRIRLNLVRTPDAGWKAAAAGPISS